MFRDSLSINADLNRHFVRYEDPLWDETEGESKPPVYKVSRSDKKDKCFLNVMRNNDIIYSIDCDKLTKAQAKFLKSQEGMRFILDQLKLGIKNISNLKKAIGEMKC